MNAKTVMVVEDSATLRSLTAISIEMEFGIRPIQAQDGLEALRLLDPGRTALILADLRMPRLDGIELIRRLKSNPDTRQIPILVISAFRGARKVAMDAGADGYLDKPFEYSDLLDKIRPYLSARRGETAA